MEERQEKQNLLAQLYALRAGLSVISSKVDEVKQLQLYNAKKRKEHGTSVAECEKQQRKVDLLRVQVAEASDSYESAKNFRSIKIKRYSRLTYDSGDVPWKAWILMMIILSCVTIGVGFAILYCGFRVSAGVTAAIVAGVLLLLNGCSILIRKSRLRKQAIASVDSEIGRARKEWKSKAKELEREEKRLAELRKRVADCSAECESTQTECDTQILQLTQEAHAYDAALTQQYSLLLATVDWENLDLVIFYLSTGRADTVKEALQQVDMQRRNDALVNEIRNANSSICREIHGGLIALSSALGECFGALRDQINAVSRQVNAQSKVIATLNGRLIDEVQLNNQLRAKANETSEQLVRDLQYIESKL